MRSDEEGGGSNSVLRKVLTMLVRGLTLPPLCPHNNLGEPGGESVGTKDPGGVGGRILPRAPGILSGGPGILLGVLGILPRAPEILHGGTRDPTRDTRNPSGTSGILSAAPGILPGAPGILPGH